MKFRIIELSRKFYFDLPYDYRIELVDYQKDLTELYDWFKELEIPYSSSRIDSSILYLRREHVTLFLLRWS